jgi:hypothetical protein
MKTPHHVVKISRFSTLALGTSFVCLLAPTPMVGQSHTPLVDPIPAGDLDFRSPLKKRITQEKLNAA